MSPALVADAAGLAALYPPPGERAVRKCIPRLDRHCRALIAASPFVVVGTCGPGGADVSPRGDAPGFVRVLDDATLLIPDRPGNNRLDTMRNLLAAPQVGLLFFLPGMDEMLRVNGSAAVTCDAALLEPSAVNGRVPRTGLLVTVREAFLHCAKAVIRSRLWDPASHVDRSRFPTAGRIQAEQIGGLDAEATQAEIAEQNARMLY